MKQSLRILEAEAIRILRESVGAFVRPVLMFSVGKDSMVLLHLAAKAFAPGRIPFPVLHVDTGWKFKEMIEFRDRIISQYGAILLVWTNKEGLSRNINPIKSGASVHTRIMKTEALKQALDHYKFDVAIGGARRDEEKSRAKERIFSFRAQGHIWDPRGQRPELWNNFNTRLLEGESMRAFPLSNWTELDVWEYIEHEGIDLVPLYFAKVRPVVHRSGTWIMVDDDRLPLEPGEVPTYKSIRFRTLGCYPLSGGIESQARTLSEVLAEMRVSRLSERQGRLIDGEGDSSMEAKKREGYF